jgi:hypothetical protein
VVVVVQPGTKPVVKEDQAAEVVALVALLA